MPAPRATGLVWQGFTDFAIAVIADFCRQFFSEWPMHRNIDSSRADLMARASLARQIEVTVQGLQEGYSRALFDQEGNAPTTGTLDEQVVRSVVDRSLVGSYRHRGSYVEREGEGRVFCSMMKVSQDGIEEMLSTVALMNSLDGNPDVFTKDQMREMMMSERMTERLNQQLESMR